MFLQAQPPGERLLITLFKFLERNVLIAPFNLFSLTLTKDTRFCPLKEMKTILALKGQTQIEGLFVHIYCNRIGLELLLMCARNKPSWQFYGASFFKL